ncbi:MAG: hypothetical protein PVG89_14945 [Gammaproteobacteria bacterium]|jgi:hypothetical protein
MKKTNIVGISLSLALGAGSVMAAGEGPVSSDSFAVLNGAQAQPLSDAKLESTYGKHFTINLPNGNTIHASGTNSAVFDHVTLTLGGGAAVISGLPAAVAE